MGFFGTYLYDGSQRKWSPAVPAIDELPDVAPPWLLVDIHDSDITTVTYRPAGRGAGVAYLGETPRTYFDDEQASAPTDVAREAAGLADWWLLAHGDADAARRAAKEIELRGYLAEDLDPREIDIDEDEDTDEPGAVDEVEIDDSEVFVELKTGSFLAALDLPLPAELRR